MKTLSPLIILALWTVLKAQVCTTGDDASCYRKEEVNFHSKLGSEPFNEYPAAPGSGIKAVDKSSITSPAGAEINMQFAELHAKPGAIREWHWHINSGEWGYVKSGKCAFALMDGNGRFNYVVAKEEDVWYFPIGWGHYFQAVDERLGCTMLFWFDKSSANIDITRTIAEVPRAVARSSLNNIPENTLESLIYPVYDVNTTTTIGVIQGKIPDPIFPESTCKGKSIPCDGTLEHWPAFPIRGGNVNEVPGVGIEYQVKSDVFPAARTMSGGLVELSEGGIREIHWHPNAEEQHYILKGKVEVTVFGVDTNGKQLKQTFELGEGDVGIVPINFIHYVKALEGPASFVVTFNSPSWESQTFSQSSVSLPTSVTAATLGTSEKVIEQFFPTMFTPFIKS